MEGLQISTHRSMDQHTLAGNGNKKWRAAFNACWLSLTFFGIKTLKQKADLSLKFWQTFYNVKLLFCLFLSRVTFVIGDLMSHCKVHSD